MHELANDELMPPKRRLLPFKTACHIRVVRMTCSYPPEARWPVTIIVVAYKDRGDSPFTDKVSLYDAGFRLTQRPLREVPTFAGNLFVIPVWDDVTHTTLTILRWNRNFHATLEISSPDTRNCAVVFGLFESEIKGQKQTGDNESVFSGKSFRSSAHNRL